MANKKAKRAKDSRRRSKQDIEPEEFVPKAFKKKDNKNIDKKTTQKGKRAENNKSKKKLLKKIILIAILIVIIILAIWLGITSNTWATLAKEMTTNENSTVLDTDGNTIATLGAERKNEKITLEEMPENLKNAYVAIEDERFYNHHGIDIKRTGGAILSYVVHLGSSSYGGSTITQQLVKNLTGDSTDSITRKVKEWWKAFVLEMALSKDEILETYLNIIYVGPNMYGVQTGSIYYFNKSAANLSLAECAFLAGINNSPNSYNPFGEEDNSEKINNRTKTVLGKMQELKYISDEEYNNAIAEVDRGLKFNEGTIESQNPVYSYHTDALILEVTEDIEEKYNISEDFATNFINMAGLTIQSTQDTSIQEETETEFEKSKYQLASKTGGDPAQAAMVIIDHKTGHVVACTGGLGEKTEPRSLNRATQSVRQTGSSIKPIAVLAPAIDKKVITGASIYDDTERDFADGYHPVDYSTALGKITVRRAVESSQNIPFVEIMEQIKPSTAMNYLEKMGVSTLTDEDNSLALALGGLQKGISPLEMAGAYATIANDGEYIEPTFYEEILNKARETILEPDQESRRVFSKEVAFILKNILTQPVVGSHGTATYCKINGVDVAAKTGTTDDNFDRWLCGFTPYYTAATWYGYDQNESIDFNNRNPAGLLWANVMSRIHTGLKSAKFEKPNTVSSATICADTGKRARTGCTNTYTEYFLWLTTPGLCDEHSGDEVGNSSNTNKTQNNNTQEIVQGITQDIDATEPPRTDLNSNTITENENTTQDTTTTNTQVNINTNRTNTITQTNTTNSSRENTSSSSNTTNRINTNTSGGSSSNTSTSNSTGNRVNTSNTTTSTNTTNRTDSTTDDIEE